MKRYSVRYLMMTFHYEQLWLPASFWLLFVLVCLFKNSAAFASDALRGYLCSAGPLVGGIMAAYALLDDRAIELRFSTPTSAGCYLLERLGPVFLVQMFFAISFQGVVLALGGDFREIGSAFDVQMVWFVPTINLIALGSLSALLGAQPVIGAFFAGFVWIVELLAHTWLVTNAARYVLIVMGGLFPRHPDLLANRVVLLSLSLLFILASWRLLRQQERYI